MKTKQTEFKKRKFWRWMVKEKIKQMKENGKQE